MNNFTKPNLWTEKDTEFLIECYVEKRLTLTQIEVEFNDHPDLNARSRSAIGARVARLNLSDRIRPKKKTILADNTEFLNEHEMQGTWVFDNDDRADDTRTRCSKAPKPDTSKVTPFRNTSNNSCKYILLGVRSPATGDSLACNADTVKGHSYCAHHLALCAPKKAVKEG